MMEGEARMLARHLGLPVLAINLSLRWQTRLRTTAGRACAQQVQIQLNPRLLGFSDELRQTFLHEMAHLVAHARYPKRRLVPHGKEWRRACADLGIPGEKSCHTLSLAPRRKVTRRHVYHCPHCNVEIARVRPLRRSEACLACCRTHAQGRYDRKFRLLPGHAQRIQTLTTDITD